MTLFSEVYDKFLGQVNDYELDAIYQRNPSDLELQLEKYLVIAVPYFRLSRTDLSYELMQRGLFDETLSSNYSTGDTVISGLSDTSGLIAGMELTIMDDNGSETVTISSVDSTSQITVSALIHNYLTADNSKIYRDELVTKNEGFFVNDLTNEEQNILSRFIEWAWANQQVNDVTVFALHLQSSDFKTYAEQSNLKGRRSNAKSILQEAERQMLNYSWNPFGDRSGL